MKSKLLAALILSVSAMFATAQAQVQDDAPAQDDAQAQVQNDSPAPDESQEPQAEAQNAPEDGSQQQQEGVDTAAGVARISLIHGAVSTQRGDSSEWSSAVLNAPIVSGDKISTGDDSRAEVQLDYANILRLSNRSQATIAQLTRNQIQVQVAQGIVNYDVFKDGEAAADIDTPNVSIHPVNREGSYRIEVRSDGETEIVVRKGELDISTPQGSTHLQAGQDAIIRGTSTDAQYKTSAAPPNDEWDRWNSDRDHTIQSAQSWSHTDRYYTGSEDLDAYGHWGNIPDYGPVWYPSVDVGWAPYRAGRWVWEPYWGWTWVSYEPWGWAPYHYGRWMQYGGAWAWWPGPVGVGFGFGYPYRPIWAPAYVSFFGFGGGGFGFSAGFGFGSVGWLPLGPCDRFYPWWGRYHHGFTFVDFHHYNSFHGGFGPLHRGNRFSNLRLAATNERFRRSISVMDAHRFGTVGGARGVRAGEFQHARMVSGNNIRLNPTHASMRASNRPASPSTIHRGAPTRFFNRQAGAHTASFGHQGSQNGFHGFANNQVHAGNVSAGNHASFAARNNNNVPRPNSGMHANGNAGGERANGGWRSFNSNPSGRTNRPVGSNMPAGRNNSFNRTQNFGNNAGMRNNIPRPSNSAAPQNTNRGGWQRFTPQSHSAMPSGGSHAYQQPSYSRPSYSQPSYGNGTRSYGSYGGSYSRPESSGRYSGGYGGNGSGYSRPPLNMRQPVVTQRSQPSYGGGGGYHGGGGGGYHGGGGSGGYHGGGGGGGYHGGGGGGGYHGGGGGGSHGGGGGGHSGGGRH
jgi:hypothetical protein